MVADVNELIAAHLVKDDYVGGPDSWRYKVLLALADRGSHGATDEELADELKPPGGQNNIRPRRGELQDKGLVETSSSKRATSSGKLATVRILASSIRPALTPALTQRDCDLAELVYGRGAGTPTSTDRAAASRLQARMALLARQAIRPASTAGSQVAVDVDTAAVGFTAWRTSGGSRHRLHVQVDLAAGGLTIALVLPPTTDIGDQAARARAEHFRSELASLPAELLAPLDHLVTTGWAPVIATTGGDTQAANATTWLQDLGTNPAAKGLLRRTLPVAELEPLGAGIVTPVAELIAAVMVAEDAAEVAMRDPVQALVTGLLWSEEKARALLALANRAKQLLFTGPPGTGKTLAARTLALALADPARVRLVQFHPTYAYEDFVEGIRPVLAVDDDDPNSSSAMRFEIRRGVFQQLVKDAIKTSDTARHFLIIDEINRANLPRVLGELLFALEYRGKDNEVELPYSGEPLHVPENLWLIGTMNTADRSVALMDAAMRRRFKEVRFDVDLDALQRWHDKHTSTDLGKDAVARLKRINAEVVDLLDEDRAIGQSFLMRPDLAEVGFETIWREDLEPVLRDHLLGRTDDLPSLREAFLGKVG